MGDFPTSLFISDLIPYLHIGPIYNLYEQTNPVSMKGVLEPKAALRVSTPKRSRRLQKTSIYEACTENKLPQQKSQRLLFRL